MKPNRKRLLSWTLSLCMVFPLFSAPVFAEDMEQSEESAIVEEIDLGDGTAEGSVNKSVLIASGETQTYIPDADTLPNNDELFAGYVLKTLYGDSGISLLGDYGQNSLTGLEQAICIALKAKIAAVANGTESSTQFTLTWDELGVQTTWTKEELGVDAIISNGAFTDEVKTAVAEKIAFNWSTILKCLLADCPYELYWYDKTKSTSYSSGGYSGNSNAITLTGNLTFYLPVCQDYAIINSDNTYELYITDTAKTGAATIAADNAQSIVTANANRSDYEKLVAYKEAICELVSYNYDAANNANTPYGDPWQLIYVFDGDSNTNVVCEGYSKAFQYLCDLSSFQDETFACYTVTGTMTAGTGGGAHMWNIVTLGGKNYLVDVTNCDGEVGASTVTVGYPDKLFLVGTTGSVESAYVFADVSNISYVYDTNTKNLYGTSILTLAENNYTEDETKDDGIGAELSGYTLSLSGNIGVNFYMQLSDDVLSDTGAYMHFTLPGTNHTETEVKVSDAAKETVGGKTYYVFSCGVAAKEMTGEIKAQMVLSDGTRGEEYTYSVKAYADYIIAHPENYSEKTIAMVKALLNYGGYAQLYFGYNIENLANAGLNLELGSPDLDDSYKYSVAGSAEGLTYVGTSLMFTTETGIRHYFSVGDGYDINNYTFTCNDVTLMPVASGSYYYVEIKNISAGKLSDLYAFRVNDSEYMISYGAYTYIKAVLAGNYSESLQNVVKALYQYGESAKAYLN